MAAQSSTARGSRDCTRHHFDICGGLRRFRWRPVVSHFPAPRKGRADGRRQRRRGAALAHSHPGQFHRVRSARCDCAGLGRGVRRRGMDCCCRRDSACIRAAPTCNWHAWGWRLCAVSGCSLPTQRCLLRLGASFRTRPLGSPDVGCRPIAAFVAIAQGGRCRGDIDED